MAYTKRLNLPDGQELALHNAGNTTAGLLRMDGQTLRINGATGNIGISSGSNLIFLGSAATIGGSGTVVSLGYSGDTVALDVTGVTYRLPQITGNLSVTSNLSVSGNATVGGDLTINKTGTYSTITFPAQTNDPAFIRHYESNNSARMEFSVSDDTADTDYFSFGATQAATWTETARLTAAGNWTMKGLTLNGNAAINGDVHITRSGSDREMLKLGAVAIGQHNSDNEFIITGLTSGIRFGQETAAASWDFNKWAGIKYSDAAKKLTIGGPASSEFESNASPPTILLSLEGLNAFRVDASATITSNQSLLNLYGTNHGYISFYPQGSTGGRFGYMGYGSINSSTFTLNNEKAGGGLNFLTGGDLFGFDTGTPSAKFHFNATGYTDKPWYADLGNYSGTITLFEHTGTSTPVPFELRKSGDTSVAADYGILHLHKNTATAGAGANLHFTLNNAGGGKKEYGGLGAIIHANTSGAEAGSLVFYTTNGGVQRGERMRITSTGNVGIGRTDPGYKLDITGDIRVSGSFQSADIQQFLNGSNAQGIKVGSLVVSNSYSNGAPANGIYSTGEIQSASVIKGTGFQHMGTGVESKFNLGTWTDPHSGVAYAIKASGGVATDKIHTGTINTTGDITFGNKALIASNAATNNIDHIWHGDSTGPAGSGGSWHFVSDGTYQQTGNSRMYAGNIWMSVDRDNYIAGNLGLGKSDPTVKLDVAGSAKVSGDVSIGGRFTMAYNSSQDALEFKVI